MAKSKVDSLKRAEDLLRVELENNRMANRRTGRVNRQLERVRTTLKVLAGNVSDIDIHLDHAVNQLTIINMEVEVFEDNGQVVIAAVDAIGRLLNQIVKAQDDIELAADGLEEVGTQLPTPLRKRQR
jgi:hypothetical protein